MKVSQEELEDFELDFSEYDNAGNQKIKGKSRPLNK